MARPRKRVRNGLAAGTLGCAAALLGCRDPSSTDENGTAVAASAEIDPGAEAPEQEAVLVRVQPVQVGPIEHKLEITATVESLDTVDVISEHAEPVLEVLVEEGDTVVEGQVLARLRTDVCKMNLAEAEVRVEEARNALERAQRDHQRNQELASQAEGASLVTQSELDESSQRVIAADTALAAGKVALDRARYDLARCELRAPIGGTVTLRDVSVGDFAAVGQRVFQIVDLSSPKAVFYRPQREFGLLHPGQQLVATSEAFPGFTIPGSIERISPTVDAVSGTVKVTAALNPGEQSIPAGILVRLHLVLDRHESAILVPKRALLYEGRNPYCFVVREGRALRIDCQPGYESPAELEVLPGPDSVHPEDVVIIVGADRVSTGDPVRLAEE